MAKNLPNFQIKKIKEFSFFINEPLFELNKEVRVQFQHFSAFHNESNIVEINLKIAYSYDHAFPLEAILIEHQVQNLFELPNLKDFQKGEGQHKLPPETITTMVSVSVSHSRALLCNLYRELFIKKTFYQL